VGIELGPRYSRYNKSIVLLFGISRLRAKSTEFIFILTVSYTFFFLFARYPGGDGLSSLPRPGGVTFGSDATGLLFVLLRTCNQMLMSNPFIL
jgi:hypothetical protein